MTDEEIKAAAKALNDKFKNKCLRHQVQKPVKKCWLCEAKQQAGGQSELARKIFINNGVINYGF